MRLFFLLLSLAGFCPPALATDPDLTGSVVQMLLGLGLIVGLLIGSLYLLKRLGVGRAGEASLIKVRSAAHVGPRERVVVVEVADKVLVLGVAPGRVTPLATLDPLDLPLSANTASHQEVPGGKDFQAWLKQTLERRSR